MNIKYLLSSRFTEYTPSSHGALDCALQILKTFVEKVALPDELLKELLVSVSALNVGRHQYPNWTAAIGAFMTKMSAYKFFSILPLHLVEHDLNSLTYAQDSRSWLLTLIGKNLKVDAHIDFYVSYFLPIIMQLDKLRELEHKAHGSDIKVKKYETLLVQIWQLLPQFCMCNCAHQSDSFMQLLNFLEPILNQNLLGLRPVALKTFSAVISH